jgi:hypothetical protein
MCVSRRTDRFSGSRVPRGGLFDHLPGMSGPRACVTEPLTPLSRTPSDIGAAHFRGARTSDSVGIRRDRFHLAAVTRRSFSRSRTPSLDKRCAALLPASRPAIAHPFPGSRPPDAFGIAKPELAPVRFAWCCAPRAAVFSTLRRLRLLSPRVASQRETSYETARPLRAERDFARLHPKARPPFTASPNHPFECLRLGEGLLWAEPPIDFCNETTTYGHHPRGRSAPASKPRASRETNDPLAFAHASVRLPVSHLAMGPARPCRGQRAVKVRPRADSLPTASPRFPWNPPRYSHGPTVLKRRARSLLGVLRAPLLRRQPSIPSSPACCHGSLESFRRASRGPSRPVSRVERGRVRHHGLV